MMKRLRKMKENQKGFTLVELIVVLVILAILAAMLVPALLGYIDKAKQGKFDEEVHSIYTALQVCYDEAYAKGKIPSFDTSDDTHYKYADSLKDMIDPTVVTAVTEIKSKSTTNATTPAPADKKSYSIVSFKVKFTSQADGVSRIAEMSSDGTISVKDDTTGG